MRTDEDIAIHQGETSATPEEVGYDPETLARLDALLKRLVGEGKLQCAGYLLSRHGKVFAHMSLGRLCGFAERGEFLPDSIRRIASVTKIFTAIAVLQLIERGDLYLTMPVKAVIPEFDTTAHGEINLFHLLTHTSGLPADPGYFLEPYPADLWDKLQDKDWVKAGLSGPLQARIGEAWNYSCFAYLILGEIVSRVSATPFEDYVRQNVITPLEMERTFFDVPAELQSQMCLVGQWEEERLRSAEDRADGPPRAAGGIYSTMADTWRLGQLMLAHGTWNGRRILGRKTVEQMTENNLPEGIPAFHWGDRFKSYQQGLGWRVTSRNLFSSPGTFGHEGAGRCSLYIDPVEEFVAVVMVPSALRWVPESVVGAQAVIWSGIV